jgi:hypothetical protein
MSSSNNVVFLADHYRRHHWLRDEKRFERRFAAGMATGLASGWLTALATALWLSDDDSERDQLGVLVDECAAEEGVDFEELLSATHAHEDAGTELRDWSVMAAILAAFVARELAGEDTSEPRARVAAAMHVLLQRRWVAEAQATRQRRLERQRRKRREAAAAAMTRRAGEA